MRIGTPASRASAKIASAAAIAELERLGARVELDPARAAREAALGLADRVLGRVQAAVRDEPAAALARPPEHAVVRDPVAGVAVGVVERERARARVGRDLVEGGDERLDGRATGRPRRGRGACGRRGPPRRRAAARGPPRGTGRRRTPSPASGTVTGRLPRARRAPRRRRPRCCRGATRRAAARRARPRRCRPPRAARGRPGRRPRRSRESDGSSPRPARKRFARPTSWALMASTPIALTSASGGLRADPREPRRRGVEAARGRRQAQRRAEVRAVHVLARVPAGGRAARCRRGAPARTVMNAVPRGDMQPLVGVADDDVEARRRRTAASPRPGSRRSPSSRRGAAAAAAIASRSATSPVAICTALAATTSVRASIAPATLVGRRRAAPSRRDASWAMNGNRTEAKSMSGREHARAVGQGRGDEAERARRRSRRSRRSPGATRTSAANASRAPFVASPQCSQLVAPGAPVGERLLQRLPRRSRAGARSSRC